MACHAPPANASRVSAGLSVRRSLGCYFRERAGWIGSRIDDSACSLASALICVCSRCLTGLLAAAPSRPRPPLVLAAASLQESLTAAADAWARAGHPRPVIVVRRVVGAGAAGGGGGARRPVRLGRRGMDGRSRRSAGCCAPGTRANLLGNRLVLVAPASRARPVRLDDRRGDRRARCRRGPVAMADPDSGARRQIWQGGAEPARRVAGGRAARRPRRKRPRGAGAGRARRGAATAIVYATDCARVAGGARGRALSRRRSHPPIVYPLARLKASRQRRGGGLSPVPAQRARQGDLRALRLHGALNADRPTNGASSGCRCRSAGSPRSRRCRSRSRSPGCCARRGFPARCCSTRWSICRWWCRRW